MVVFMNGVNFGDKKLVKKALTHFFALGTKTAERIMAKYSIYPRQRVEALSPKTVIQLNAELSTMTIENDARGKVVANIQRLKDIGTYRGRRHNMHLPVRGQRTRNQTATPNQLNKVERFGKW